MFSRTLQLLGETSFSRLQTVRVILFGVGGVGGWCAESLVRTGVQHLTIVDFDTIAPSNLNRQVVATSANVGQLKVEEMCRRLLAINPAADIVTVPAKYGSDGMLDYGDRREAIDFSQYDYVIDAIDTLDCKLRLIHDVTSASLSAEAQSCGSNAPLHPVLFSSMGAGRKVDPLQVRVAEFWKVEGCPLARALRQRFKRMHSFPAHKFLVVFSDELLTNQQPSDCADTDAWSNRRARTNGSLCHEVGIFGFTLAGLVIQDIVHLMHN